MTDDYPFIDGAFVRSLAPYRPDDGHKGSFGRVLLWAGSPRYSGAAHLCVQGALRSGVGLVHLWTGRETAPFFAQLSPSVITDILPPETTEDATLIDRCLQVVLPEAMANRKAVAIGPGLTLRGALGQRMMPVVLEQSQKLVVDAGAFGYLAESGENGWQILSRRVGAGRFPAVLTPHHGEFARLCPGFAEKEAMYRQTDLKQCFSAVKAPDFLRFRASEAIRFARVRSCVVVLKGRFTVIASPNGDCCVNPTGNHGMGKGGSGDVLTGLLGGFLAQGLHPFSAACCAVYLHGLAGDFAARDLGARFMQPTDLVQRLPEAYRTVGWV